MRSLLEQPLLPLFVNTTNFFNTLWPIGCLSRGSRVCLLKLSLLPVAGVKTICSMLYCLSSSFAVGSDLNLISGFIWLIENLIDLCCGCAKIIWWTVGDDNKLSMLILLNLCLIKSLWIIAEKLVARCESISVHCQWFWPAPSLLSMEYTLGHMAGEEQGGVGGGPSLIRCRDGGSAR